MSDDAPGGRGHLGVNVIMPLIHAKVREVCLSPLTLFFFLMIKTIRFDAFHGCSSAGAIFRAYVGYFTPL